jgi:cytochrome c oxidase assembly protein subunit 11
MTPAAPLTPHVAPPRHGRLIAKCLLGVAAAFAFAFALVPLYDTFCRALGLNGKTFVRGGLETIAGEPAPKVDASRIVTVEFVGTVMPGLPWELRPLDVSVDLHPGELQHTRFLVRNTAKVAITGQAIPSVSPGQAASHFQKIECFCFTQQTLGPGEAREMPLAFIVKPELSEDIRTISLSYVFYPAPAATPAPSTLPKAAGG